MTAETLSRFYRPKAIVWNSYYRHYELVLGFDMAEKDFVVEGYGWTARVVPCTDKGVPNGNPYSHHQSPTQDCFDGTAARIHGIRPLFGMISPGTGYTPRKTASEPLCEVSERSASGIAFGSYQEQEAGKPE